MLTIAIPTYNRSRYLDRQLRWLASALPGHDHDVEILISDNASTDDTPAVVQSWASAFAHAEFISRRHPTNIGAVSNIASCIRSATHRHVWTIGDDDKLDRRALAAVLERLRERPDLGLLTLNFSSRHALTGLLRFARCYPVERDRFDPGGMDLFTYCLDHDYGGVALTTAQVYRTDAAQRAQEAWPREDNLMVQVYWSAFCAREGGMLLTAENYLECAAGTHYFMADPNLQLRLHLADTPELGAQLARLGYNPRVCRELTLKQLARRHHGMTIVNALRVDPRTALGVLAAFAGWVWWAGPLRAIGYLTGKLIGRLRRWMRPHISGA